ncbi:hypothetical protein H8D83_00700, partial [Candidatus Woesearchaeota archaeon]|nr:hypothetical protein [Candidatus Woesearchaeota archaeon]
MDKWILSDTYMQFEGINLHITVDEERGNYEMSVILPFLDNLDYLPQLGRGLWDVGFEFNESNNLYHFKDKENKYVVDKKAKYANLTFIREDREGFLLEEEVEEL